MGDVCVSHLVEKVAIFIWFELRTPSAPSIGSHPSMLAPCYRLKFKFHQIAHYLVLCGWDFFYVNESRIPGILLDFIPVILPGINLILCISYCFMWSGNITGIKYNNIPRILKVRIMTFTVLKCPNGYHTKMIMMFVTLNRSLSLQY